MVRTQYGNKPNSRRGNDDAGRCRLGICYLSRLPVCPGSNDYGSARRKSHIAELRLSNGKHFPMTAENLSGSKPLRAIREVERQGLEYCLSAPFRVEEGRQTVFQMGPKPSPTWGVARLQ